MIFVIVLYIHRQIIYLDVYIVVITVERVEDSTAEKEMLTVVN